MATVALRNSASWMLCSDSGLRSGRGRSKVRVCVFEGDHFDIASKISDKRKLHPNIKLTSSFPGKVHIGKKP